jgi:hypothetical protein
MNGIYQKQSLERTLTNGTFGFFYYVFTQLNFNI